MRRIITTTLLAIAIHSCSVLPALQGKPALSADDAHAVRQADQALVLAASAQLLQNLPQISARDTVPHARAGSPRAPIPFVAQ